MNLSTPQRSLRTAKTPQRIAVVGGAERPEKVKVRLASPTTVPAVHREVDLLIERAEAYERMAVQARECAVELQVKVWCR